MKELIEAIASAVSVPQHLTNQDGNEFALLPPEWEMQDLEHLRNKPRLFRTSLNVQTLSAFTDYITKHGMECATAIFADRNLAQPKLVAVINYHPLDGGDGFTPSRCDHRITYAYPLSVEWKRWMEKNGKRMRQREFAEFIEDNLPDIRKPTGADMLTIAKTLEAERSSKFSSGIRLDNGDNELSYIDETKASAGKGVLQIPEIFTLGILPFIDGEGYELDARLRYRISEGSLELWYDLDRPHKVIEMAFNESVAKLKEQLPAYQVYDAEPPIVAN